MRKWAFPFISIKFQQIMGPDSRLVFEAIYKPLVPKPNSSQVIKLMDRGRVTRPRVKYRGKY